ncbi:MAG: hypothetical protein LBU65_04710, partial [Planctomycetaceae bacterium]|nr:hypothetical protein [Planctomycetaceae bacterium]
MLKYTFILTTITIVLAGTLLNAQDQPLRYDSDVLEMVKIVIKGMENPSSSKTAATSKELKPAHEVWQKWEKLKAAEDSPQSTVNADIPIAELKRLAEKGDKNALSILQTRLRQLVIDKDTEVIMLEALIKIGHTDAPRLLEERKKQQEDDKRKQKEKEEREQRDKERKAEAERKRAEAEQKRIEEKAAAEKLLAEEEANRKRLAE